MRVLVPAPRPWKEVERYSMSSALRVSISAMGIWNIWLLASVSARLSSAGDRASERTGYGCESTLSALVQLNMPDRSA